MLDLLAAAPLSYRGLLIFLSIDGSEMHVNVPRSLKTNPGAMVQVKANNWPTLRAMINEELNK